MTPENSARVVSQASEAESQDELDAQRADWEGMFILEKVDAELIRILMDDFFSGMTPG